MSRAMQANKFVKFVQHNFRVILLWLVIPYSSGVCRAFQFDGDVLDPENIIRQLGKSSEIPSNCANSTEFACDTLRCIENSKLCDGLKDCADGSDETLRACEKFLHGAPEGAERIRKRRADAVASNRCDVPGGPEMTVVITDDNKKKLNLARGSKAPRFSKLEITCNNGYALSKEGQTFQRGFCHVEEGWIPPYTPCIKTCPALKPINVQLTCNYEGSQIPCNDKLVSGTRVEPKCKPFYSAQTTYRELRCQKNGKWDQELYKCIPECGSLNELDIFIVNGMKTSIEQSPWNVAIYKISSDYLLICGGTLISPRMVVSAAHCFYDQHNGVVFDSRDYEIVVSKYARDYNKKEKPQRIHKIRRLKVHESFDPKNAGHYGFDVAVIVLEEPVALSNVALPACIDWSASVGFSPGENAFGRLAGWGIVNETNEGGVQSENLLAATLPFLSYQSCKGKLKPLPSDQFCAGSESGPGARKGDSGAGLIFYDRVKGRYYLRGIVSSGKKDSGSKVAAFTDISFHLKWLETERNVVEKEQALEEKRPTATRKPHQTTTTTSAPELDNSENGICALHDDPNVVLLLRDSEDNAISFSSDLKAPENSKLEITCRPGYSMSNGEKTQQSVCTQDGWAPSLLSCLTTTSTSNSDTSYCVANGNNCQPDGSLGYCCSGYCHKELGWTTGRCAAKQSLTNPPIVGDTGICTLHSDANSTITLTDASNKALRLPAGAKAPENSKLKITCKSGYAMANGNNALESVCNREEEGWVPTLMYCLIIQNSNQEQNCVANKKNCQPDGSLGYCCSGYCHKEFGWVTGKCRPKT